MYVRVNIPIILRQTANVESTDDGVAEQYHSICAEFHMYIPISYFISGSAKQ